MKRGAREEKKKIKESRRGEEEKKKRRRRGREKIGREAEKGGCAVERNNWGVCGCLLVVPWLQAFYSLPTRAGTRAPPHRQIVLRHDMPTLFVATHTSEEEENPPSRSRCLRLTRHVRLRLRGQNRCFCYTNACWEKKSTIAFMCVR